MGEYTVAARLPGSRAQLPGLASETGNGAGRPSRRSDRAVAGITLVAVVLVAVVPVCLFSLRAAVTPMEEGALLLYPGELLDGQWPNRDFEHVYGPGNLWTLTAVFQVTGASLPAERVVALAYRLLLAAAVYGITRPGRCVLAPNDRHDGRRGRQSLGAIARSSGAGSAGRGGHVVALAAALTAWLLVAPLVAAYSSVGAVALGVAGVWLAMEAEHTASPSRRRAFLLGAGFLTGLVVSYRFDFALVVLPAQAVLLWPGWPRSGKLPDSASDGPRDSGRSSDSPSPSSGGAGSSNPSESRGSSDRPSLRDLRWWAGAGVAGLAPLVVHVLVVGPHEAAAGMVLDPVGRHGPGRRLPVPPSLSEAPDSFTQIAHAFGETSWVPWSLPVQFSIMFWSAIAAVVVLWVVAWSRWRRGWERARTHVAVACLAAGLLPYLVQRTDPAHVTLVLAGLAPLVPWAVVSRREGGWDLRGAALAGGCIVAVSLLGAPSFLGEKVLDQYRTLGGPEDVAQVSGSEGRQVPVSAGMAPDVQELVDYLREHASPGDRLVIAPAELRKTNYNETYLYYLLPELVPGTYHLEMNPGTANASWSELPGDMEDADWVVLSNRYDPWRERNESAKLGSGNATEVVRTQLLQVATLGSHHTYTIYRPQAAG